MGNVGIDFSQNRQFLIYIARIDSSQDSLQFDRHLHIFILHYWAYSKELKSGLNLAHLLTSSGVVLALQGR